MKRMLVFLLLGPAFGVLVAFSQAVVASGIYGDYAEGCAITLMFSLIVSAITGPVDELQACVVPISLRAPLTATLGAAVAVGLLLHVEARFGNTRMPSLGALLQAAVIGVLSAGACSLLSHNHRGSKA
jgi:hypothetical protein